MRQPFFGETDRRAMRFDVSAIDHQPLRDIRLGDQGHEDPVEHAEAAPAHEAVVERLWWS